ncbi:hypothetical protein K1719_001516 [Acacia pycnantha]|nr:hypothetical protein K1719_001516 [Acacia pycnantha]
MKQIAMAGDLPFLPEEIIRNILIRLPVKSLIRLGCVCKRWKNLIIRTPSFISDHLHYSSTHQNPSLLLQRRYGIWLLDSKMELHEVENVPFIDSSTTFRIVGSSNGLLCIKVDRYYVFSPSLLLWNPATREVRQLPPIRKVLPLPLDAQLFFDAGFGFSPIDNDYKIVVIYFDCPLTELRVVAYSLSSESWKEVEFGIENVALFVGSVTVGGAMFWLGFSWKDSTIDSFYDVIVSFDIANEVFTLITLDCSIPRPTLSVYENKLAMLCLSEMEDSESLIELWVMEDGSGASWAKKFSSCLIPSVVRPVMTIWMNQIVCDASERERYHEAKITLLNISTNELKAFNISKCGGSNGSGFICNHAESLVPIG